MRSHRSFLGAPRSLCIWRPQRAHRIARYGCDIGWSFRMQPLGGQLSCLYRPSLGCRGFCLVGRARTATKGDRAIARSGGWSLLQGIRLWKRTREAVRARQRRGPEDQVPRRDVR